MRFQKTLLLINILICSPLLFAAKPVDLSHTSLSLHTKTKSNSLSATTSNTLEWKQIHQETDKQQVTHMRFQQTYRGLPVYGAGGVEHTKNGQTKLNGKVFQELDKDLAAQPLMTANADGKAKALASAKAIYQQNNPSVTPNYQQESVKEIVYIDQNQKAHYGYLVSFYFDTHVSGAHRPTMILDANSLAAYKSWDEVRTENDEAIKAGGGIGGNPKMGKQIYDGAPGHLPALPMMSYDLIDSFGTKTYCVLASKDIVVRDVAYDNNDVNAECVLDPGEHNQVYWLSLDEGDTRWKDDEINSGYSPSLDALYNATVIKKLYEEWYGIPVLVDDNGKPMRLVMRVHYGRRYDNAFWNGEVMTFGDGGDYFYPLTSLDVTAHEIAHGFTDKHSHINGMYNQMGALHESFSDMAAAAAEYYSTGKNSWLIGATISKEENRAIRWMDTPTKDGMSIDNMKDYNRPMDPHLLAGVTNKAFYLLATSSGWNTHKAFDVMVQANRYYWNESTSTFVEAACGAVSAAKDLSYPVADVQKAFTQVGVDTSGC